MTRYRHHKIRQRPKSQGTAPKRTPDFTITVCCPGGEVYITRRPSSPVAHIAIEHDADCLALVDGEAGATARFSAAFAVALWRSAA